MKQMENSTPQNAGNSNQPPAIFTFLGKNLQVVFFLGFALSVVLFFVPCVETNDMVFSGFDVTRILLQKNVSMGTAFILFFSFCASLTFAVLAIQYPRRWVFIAGACYTSLWLLYGWFHSGSDDGSPKVIFLFKLFDYASSTMILTGFWIWPDTSPTGKSLMKKCPHCNAPLTFFRVAKMIESAPYICPHCGGTSTIPKSQMHPIQIISGVLGLLAAYLFNLHYGMGKLALIFLGALIGVTLWTLGIMLFGRFEAQIPNTNQPASQSSGSQPSPIQTETAPTPTIAPSGSAIIHSAIKTQFYYSDTQAQAKGPFTFEELLVLERTGILKPETNIIVEGASEWSIWNVVKNREKR